MDRGKTKTAVRQAILFHADRHLQKIVVLLYLQINEKIVLGPVKLLEGHIVSKLIQKKNSRSLYLYANKTKSLGCTIWVLNFQLSWYVLSDWLLSLIRKSKTSSGFVELSRKQLSIRVHSWYVLMWVIVLIYSIRVCISYTKPVKKSWQTQHKSKLYSKVRLETELWMKIGYTDLNQNLNIDSTRLNQKSCYYYEFSVNHWTTKNWVPKKI